jgi:hypothetical protein
MITKHYTVCTLDIPKLVYTFNGICADIIEGLQYTYDDIIIDESNVYLISDVDYTITNTICIEIDRYLELHDFVTRSIIDKLRKIEDFEDTNYSTDVLGTCTTFMITTKYHFDNEEAK